MWYKRSIILINPQFQIKISSVIASIVFLLSLIYPLTIYELFKYLALHINPSSNTLSAYSENKGALIVILLIYQLSFTAAVFIFCIINSRKIAGPLFNLNSRLKEVADGGPLPKIAFRSGDHFSDLADNVNAAFDTIRNTHHKDFAYLSEVNSYIKNLSLVVPDDKKAVLQEICTKLNEIQDRFDPQ